LRQRLGELCSEQHQLRHAAWAEMLVRALSAEHITFPSEYKELGKFDESIWGPKTSAKSRSETLMKVSDFFFR
jgi:hypothetical protein